MNKVKYEQAVQMREKGMTLQLIGEVFNVTRERARQMIIEGQRQREARSAWYDGLSSRAVNALSIKGCRSKREVQVLLRSPEFILGGIKSVGKVTLREIVEWSNQ